MKTKTIAPEAWFQKKEKVKKKREPIPTTYLDRCLDFKNETKHSWAMRNLYMGGIGQITSKEEMRNAIREFWVPKQEEYTYNYEFYMDVGSFLGETIARRMHAVPDLTYCKEEKHKEFKIVNETFGYAGKVDLIVDINLFEHYGKKTRPEELPEKKLFRAMEVKTTGLHKLKDWEDAYKMPYKYRVQLGLYIHNLLEEGITEDEIGYFIVQSRDAPTTKKLYEYRLEDKIVSKSHSVCLEFWDYIQKREVPRGDFKHDFTKDDIEKAIISQPDREWPDRIKETIQEVLGK